MPTVSENPVPTLYEILRLRYLSYSFRTSTTTEPSHIGSKKSEENTFLSIHARFLNQKSYRESQMAIGWTEGTCSRMDALAAEDHSYFATAVERKRYDNTWRIK